jgi:hypothetical protein
MTEERRAVRDWHRLFGALLRDFFTGSPFGVEVEKDLSVQQQFLDVAIFRRDRRPFAGRLPDGMDDLGEHNLVSFKLHREAADQLTMEELVGHFVAYWKLVSPSPSDLLPRELFRLFAVCARYPHNLAGQVPWHEQQAGVYDCQWGTDLVHVLVAGQLPREEHNAPLLLFSASPELVEFAQGAYRRRSEDTSALLDLLLKRFQGEGFSMSYTLEDFKGDYVTENLAKLAPEKQQEALRALPPETRLAGLSAEERLAGLSAEERLAGLPPEQQEEAMRSLPLERRLAGLSEEQIRQYLDQLTAGRPAPPPKPRRKKK